MQPELGIQGFSWQDLFSPERLKHLHALFLDELEAAAPATATRFAGYRESRGVGMKPEAISAVLVETAPLVGAFVARLFGVTGERQKLIDEAHRTSPIFRMKDAVVKRRALKRGEIAHDAALDAEVRAVLGAAGVDDADDELGVAGFACALLDREEAAKSGAPEERQRVAATFEKLEKWLMMRRHDPALRSWMAFRLPHAVNHEDLVPLRRPARATPELIEGPHEHRRHRDGFDLTDRRMTPLEVADQIDYCLYCHERDKDSCSKGLRDKAGAAKPNPLGIVLAGCPLDEKISEMHLVRKHGDAVGALALITVDNPMCPGTGHRICNDCMKACIFQKQEPVNIPQAETGVLTDVLAMPWGFEIYGLLTRWNPLNVRRPYPLPYHGKNVLVVGLGPAGYTLVHHLANEGFGVVGIDGLKIEPLPERFTDRPIRDVAELQVRLDERTLWGFGGVSEYGITVRWDKNFLTMLYVTLARNAHVKFHGGVRFGGTLKLEDAWELGFHHVAIAAGAGRPTVIDIENNLIRGIRAASDFLMALQLTGAFKRSTLANLQVRLPAVVIGGGLTAIDTATELRAYYVIQVEKIFDRYQRLVAAVGESSLRRANDLEEQAILDEFLAHARAIRDERAAAVAAGRAPNFDKLLDAWGGVTIAYRRRLHDSPAYRLNHEEVHKALEEGVRFLENATPKAAVPDEFGALKALAFVMSDGRPVELPARTLCVAAGTSPNTIYEKEHPGTFQLDRKGYFLPHAAAVGTGGVAAGRVKLVPGPGFFTSYLDDAGHTVSYYGDNHPHYAGSVVKAMASAKDGYPAVAALFEADIIAAVEDRAGQPAREEAWRSLTRRLADELGATVVAVNRLTPTIIEVIVRAPRQARTFHPGQFYRMHNFETEAATVDGTTLLMEGLALTGAWVDPDKGLLSLIVLEMGGSSRLCSTLRPGAQVVVMGPTGTPTEIPTHQTVLLAGGGLGNAVLFSIARALRAAGNKVIYFAGYRKPNDLFKQEDIEVSTDQVVWATDVGPALVPRRPQDRAFVGNIVQAMIAYAGGELGETVAPMSEVDRIIAIGSDRMMAAVARARHVELSPYLKACHVGIGSINSPMQCMMKEVCAQCLQKHIDPTTGLLKEVVFSCFNQDQNLDEVDWKNLNDRLRQNTVQEKLADLWLEYLVARRRELIRV